jgi:hypothetical protein
VNETRQVMVLMVASFLTFSIGRGAQTKETVPKQPQLVAWGLLMVILLIGTDLDATAEVSAALAWLIFLSVMLLYGTEMFKQLTRWSTGLPDSSDRAPGPRRK